MALGAALIAVMAALVALASAVQSFERHPGLPFHIAAGTQWGHVVPGEPDLVVGRAEGAKPSTKLLLDAQEAPYDVNKFRVIATVDRLGPGGSFRFTVYPRTRTRYKVLTAVDHLNTSREVAVIVDPPPKRR